MPFCSIPLEPRYFQWCQTHRPQGCTSLTTAEGFISFSMQTWTGHLNRLARFSRGGPFWSTTGGRQAGRSNESSAYTLLFTHFNSKVGETLLELGEGWPLCCAQWQLLWRVRRRSPQRPYQLYGIGWSEPDSEKLLTLYSRYLADAHHCLMRQTGLETYRWPRVIQPPLLKVYLAKMKLCHFFCFPLDRRRCYTLRYQWKILS